MTLYNSLNGNNFGNLLNQYKKFQSMFKGDARSQIQNMLRTGQITQSQYNNAVQMANQLKDLMR